ncbi:MAG TPA: Sir2 family NAD-dependent protein deacetylase [Chitinispirillaceae bacterium]|nr:Sir2 family NAD-dependent protein deacetylase [Chitinispirillaceae bacterium]
METIIELLKQSRYCVALTGAGISTLSGIRDFRGKDGIYNDYNPDLIFDIHYFRQDPSLYYNATRDLIYNLDQKKPSIVHLELARLEAMGIIKTLITQNIDMLHTRAGSKNIIELHGSPLIHRCMCCGKTFDYQYICSIVQKGEIPECDSCQGYIKPDIVFFGEMLDPAKLGNAVLEASKADLILALGTSLLVQPAASLPLYTTEHGTLIIVNDMPTPLDDLAEARYDNLEKVFSLLKNKIR